MKKIFLFLAAVVLTVGLAFKLPPSPSDEAQVKLYVEGQVEGLTDAECIVNGSDTIILCSGKRAKQLMKEQTVLSVVISTEESLEQVLTRLNVRIVFSEHLQGMRSLYGFAPGVKFRELVLENQKVNVQIAKRQNDILIGFPIIYTDY